jgi:serpin B
MCLNHQKNHFHIYLNGLILLMVLGMNILPAQDLSTPEISRRINAFTFDLMKYCVQTQDAPQNIVFSPQSVFSGLAMTYVASSGKTRQELADALHLPDDDGQLIKDLADLRAQIHANGENTDIDIEMANAAWFDTIYAHFQNNYIEKIEQVFEAPLYYLLFAQREQAAHRINAWISEKTNNKIQNSLRPEDLISKSRNGIIEEPALVLTNTVYFKGIWLCEFDKDSTAVRVFHIDTVLTSDVMMMHQSALFLYSENSDVKFLEMPYTEAGFSMYVVLPKKILGVKELMNMITESTVTELKQRAFMHKVDVLLPKYRIQNHLDMKDALMGMGVITAFDSQHADFEKMIIKRIQAFRIYISQLFHDAWIETDEQGTEAAGASTAVHYSFGCSAPPQPVPVEFHADHPFAFFIVHNQSRSILFCGWITDPAQLVQ